MLPPDLTTSADLTIDLNAVTKAHGIKSAGTIGYEILTSLGHRYQRHYVVLGGEFS